MCKFFTGIVCLFLLPPLHAVAGESNVSATEQMYNFSNKKLATEFMKKKQALGERANLSVRKQEKQRYTVLLKGYSQWRAALKQAQLLDKQGFPGLDVVKERDRAYSIIVQQSLNKKRIGKTFNKLRSLGMENVRVQSDKIKIVRYIVKLHEIKADKKSVLAQQSAKDKALENNKIVQPSEVVKKYDSSSTVLAHKEKTREKEPVTVHHDDEITLDDDVMFIVMSDSSDITYEISVSESDDSDFEWAIDKIVLEAERMTRSPSTVDHVQYVHASGHAKWQLSNQWELQLAARVDGNFQHGERVSENDEVELDYGNNYLLYRNQSMRLTLGSDTVRWGKMDIFSPTDNISTLDLTRGVLYEWDEGYRSAPIVRSEFFFANSKLDIVYLPYFREAELADKKNVWHPVNLNEGALLGFGSTPMLKTLLQNGKINDNINATDGGFGIRYSANIDSIDIDLTVQKVKLSAPYYQINPAIVANPSLLNQEKYSLIEKHPRSWVVGGDVEFQADTAMLRFEAAWFSDLPATTKALKYVTYEGFKWAAGTEFYPGDGDTRINLQLSGTHINEKEKILDRDNIVSLISEVETLSANNRWRLGGRFNLGIDEKDIYISPEIAYLGWEPFEIYSAIHYLDGDDNTIGGFYKNNSMVTIGWRGQF